MAEGIRFEWDPHKAEANRRKHGIDFALAARVFFDRHSKTIFEGDEHGEARWRTIGEIGGIAVVVVSHTLRTEREFEVVRIISARKATRRERRQYEETP